MFVAVVVNNDNIINQKNYEVLVNEKAFYFWYKI